MNRSALAVFFQRVLVTTLPLAAPACQDSATTTPDAAVMGAPDLAVAVPDDFAFASPDLYDSCDVNYPVTRVNNDPGKFADGGFPAQCLYGSACTPLCPPGYMMCCAPTPSDGGAIIVDCSLPCPGGGRRPSGLAPAPTRVACNVGAYFATMAHLEAASVASFRRLGRELRAQGAPARLVEDARRAAGDEVRHARIMRSFAAQHGCKPAPVRVRRLAARSVEAIARENAAEGCVRETFGALVASWQARTAGDRAFASAMSRIAADETRHAELSWAVDGFLRSKLSPPANRRVRRARQAVVQLLASELEQAPPEELVQLVGLPDRSRVRTLFDAANRALWSD
jgi:hypothetical protein